MIRERVRTLLEDVAAGGTTIDQALPICEHLAAKGDGFLVTRSSDAQRAALAAKFPAARLNPMGRTVHLAGGSATPAQRAGTALIVTAGTSDLAVAEEAAETHGALGITVARLTDVGV